MLLRMVTGWLVGDGEGSANSEAGFSVRLWEGEGGKLAKRRVGRVARLCSIHGVGLSVSFQFRFLAVWGSPSSLLYILSHGSRIVRAALS